MALAFLTAHLRCADAAARVPIPFFRTACQSGSAPFELQLRLIQALPGFAVMTLALGGLMAWPFIDRSHVTANTFILAVTYLPSGQSLASSSRSSSSIYSQVAKMLKKRIIVVVCMLVFDMVVILVVLSSTSVKPSRLWRGRRCGARSTTLTRQSKARAISPRYTRSPRTIHPRSALRVMVRWTPHFRLQAPQM